jgi:hypothetical protein
VFTVNAGASGSRASAGGAEHAVDMRNAIEVAAKQWPEIARTSTPKVTRSAWSAGCASEKERRSEDAIIKHLDDC